MTFKETIKKFIPGFLLRFYHFCLALLGAVIFGFPGKDKRMKIIAVTGTNGKSTTVEFISKIFESAGIPCASQSTVRFKIKEREFQNNYKMTMPGRFFIQKFLRQALSNKCQYAILEVTSEGIRQFRHKFINFDTAIFTNLSPEHIESHGSFENYRNEKLKLFKAAKNIHIINTDDQNAKYFLDIPAKKTITYSLEKGDVNMVNTKLKLSLEGKFNNYNALAAVCVGLNYGISKNICIKAVEDLREMPGRMEKVVSEPFSVFIDYAFTPNALEKVYTTLKPRDGRLVCVLGACGGGRDKWKRPVLGKIAKDYCDEIIITNEDPYDEDPMEIINQVAETAGPKAQKILNREEAIKTAIKLSKPQDVVIITGKGSEPWMCVANGKKIPWDDRQIARKALNKN